MLDKSNITTISKIVSTSQSIRIQLAEMSRSCRLQHYYAILNISKAWLRIFIPDLPILMFYPPIKHFSYWLPFPLGYFISHNNMMQKTLFPCQIVLEKWSKMSWKSWKCPGIPVGKKNGHPETCNIGKH